MQVVNRTRELVLAQIECLSKRDQSEERDAALARLNAELATFPSPDVVVTMTPPSDALATELVNAREQLGAVSAERDSLGAQVNALNQALHDADQVNADLRAQLAAAKKKTAGKAKRRR